MSIVKDHSHFVVLPTEGQPYIWTSFPKNFDKKKAGSLVKQIVQGDIASIRPDYVAIHPMFQKTPRWYMAQKLIKAKGVKIYMNADDTMVCDNFAVLVDTSKIETGGRPCLGGDILIHVSDAQMRAKRIDTDELRIVNPREEDGEIEPFDPEDDEEEEKILAECKKNGWDSSLLEDVGIIYKKTAK